MRKTRNFVLVLIASALLVSCFDNETELDFEVYTDAYVLKKNIGDSSAYAVTLFALGNQLIHSVTVTEIGGSGEIIQLTQDPSSLFTMSKIPVETDYLPFAPASNDYLFEVVAENGVTKEKYDFLSYEDLDIPEITKTEFSENKRLLSLNWTGVEGADGFIIKILNSEGVLVFNDGVQPDITQFSIDIVMGNWIIYPEKDETYNIQVHAFAYEPDTEEEYRVYNIQEVSISEVSIVWE